MRITQIIKQKNSKNRYNIFVEGKFAFSASLDDIIKFSLAEGLELSNIELENIINFCEISKAYSYALNLLKFKNYTSNEIERKLLKKHFSPNTIKNIIVKLSDYGFINDEQYAIKYINDSLNMKKYGERKIIYSLKRKGINRDIIDKSIVYIDKDIQFNNAYNLLLKKIESLKEKTNAKQKLFRYLLLKGYEYDIAINAVQKALKEFKI